MHILEPAAIRALEQRLFDGLGLPPALVMDTAGRAVADAIGERLGAGDGRKAEVLCGVGNNGGDGLVVARWLACRGWRVRCWIAGDEARWSPEARVHRQALAALGLASVAAASVGTIAAALREAHLVVDAWTGLGLQGELREPLRSLVGLDTAGAMVVAVDLPSGLCAQTGRVLGAAMRCDLVVTVGAPKPGLLLGEGPRLWRDLVVADIGLPPPWVSQAARGRLLDERWARMALPARSDEGHKNRFGHVVLVAGSMGKAGAALLAATACLRSGAGLATLLTASDVCAALQGRVPDLMVDALAGPATAVLAQTSRASALAVGPGLGESPERVAQVCALFEESAVPAVFDADALTCLGRAVPAPPRSLHVLTPHPAEAARLGGCSVADVLDDPLSMALGLAARYAAIVVLKGPRTLVAAPDGQWAVLNQPNAALAKAGSGDVLTGVIAALLGQGLAPFAAAALGVWVHGEAGQLMRQRHGLRSGLASDLPPLVAEALAGLEQDWPLVPAGRDR